MAAKGSPCHPEVIYMNFILYALLKDGPISIDDDF